MVKQFALLFVGLLSVGLAMPQDVLPNLQSSNYDANIAFIQGFMTGYAGTGSVPATCFDATVINTLNADLGTFMLSMAGGSFSKAITSLEQFAKDLITAQLECGLQIVPQSFEKDIQSEGAFYLLVNLIHNAKSIQNSYSETVTYFQQQQWTQAGQSLGTLAKLIIPPTPSKLVGAQKSTLSDWSSFVTGLLNGLEGSTTTPGKCYQAFSTAGQQLPTVIAAFEKVESEGIAYVLDFANAVRDFLPYVTPLSTDCAWNTLEAQIAAIFNGGIKSFAMRYYTNIKVIDADLSNVRVCETNFNECGRSLGEVMRLLLNWSLNAEKLPHFEAASYSDLMVFLGGLAKGLEGEVSTAGPCYQALSTAGTSANTIVAEIEKLAGGDFTVVSQLIEDIKAFLPQAESIDGVCPFKALFESVDAVFKPDGFKPFFVRYYKYIKTVNADLYNVVNCSADYSLCGQSLGNAIDLLFNWALN
eukprot:CAMPEP_0202941566 /NCGR_PEP_ID=MMETSP1395-20130829/1684_1 /ASSEMBLY_ACC=CAM_ASM_000871 /TAXON_ID=5961 /ORGANISM="Blepharisma japonicum, Strain Stock R1072" /LENGTH=471 /DNA_ID=CAMNT_0049636905 /DNA_START=16 /DNA_END=1431 /DNA_ORIENTATION=+